MNKILLTLCFAALAAGAARAQSEAVALSGRSFEAQAADAIRPFVLEDSFAGVAACDVLDAKTFRAWTLDEASKLSVPCLQAVGRKYSAEMTMQAGLLASAPARPGLILKTDLVPGSKAQRDLLASIDRRGGRLLGHPVRVLTRGEVLPASVSAVQQALHQCILTTVVRDISSGADFVKIYGSCLTRNPDLKIAELRAGAGLTVEVKTERTDKDAEALNGFVTVNAGKGPVQVMIIASGAQAAAR